MSQKKEQVDILLCVELVERRMSKSANDFNPDYAIENFYCVTDEKIVEKQFFIRVNPDKNYVFRRPFGQITLLHNLGLS